jgi:hypothetical protein
LPPLLLALAIPLVYGLITLAIGFSHPYMIQDDARQHVVWLQQLVHPQWFANDTIAQYYRAIAPIGFTTFYASFAKLGLEPLVLAKILPLFLGVITTFYSFKLFLQILPIPAAAWIYCLVLNQAFWLKDDVVSASPRAFLYPLFAAFLYYLSKRSLIPCLITVLLQGLFFPQMVLVDLGILFVRLFRWCDRSLRLSQERSDYWLCGLGWAIGLGVTLPFSHHLAEQLGDIFSVAQMRAMPEFGTQGRTRYFGVSAVDFWLNGSSGIRPPLLPPVIWASTGLVILLRSRHEIRAQITPRIGLLGQILVASLGLYAAAHVLLPRLYFPNRYTYHSLRFVMAIAAGIVLFAGWQSWWRWVKNHRGKALGFRKRFFSVFVRLFIVATVLIPATPQIVYLTQSWNRGENAEIYQYLAAQPADIRVATLDAEGDNIPAFAGRSVWVSGEFAFAFHVDYYNEMRRRAEAVLRAQYSDDLADIQKLMAANDLDFWLVNRAFLRPEYLLGQVWLVNSSFREAVFAIVTGLQRGQEPGLVKVLEQCAVAETADLVLLVGKCLR